MRVRVVSKLLTRTVRGTREYSYNYPTPTPTQYTDYR